MIHRNKIFTNFATSNKDYPVHSSSGPGRRPLTAETRVSTPGRTTESSQNSASFSFYYPFNSKTSYESLKLYKNHVAYKSFATFMLFIFYITYNIKWSLS